MAPGLDYSGGDHHKVMVHGERHYAAFAVEAGCVLHLDHGKRNVNSVHYDLVYSLDDDHGQKTGAWKRHEDAGIENHMNKESVHMVSVDPVECDGRIL